MATLTDLRVPIIVAPMAGGPSTPALVAAAHRAGGVGFLAAGYLTAPALDAQIGELPRDARYGVNIFVPGRALRDRPGVEDYRRRLQLVADRYTVALPEIVDHDDDAYEAKIDLVIRRRVPLVSFTFGLPSSDVVAQLHAAGIEVIASISAVDEAQKAISVGVDALCVQGAGAGGHRATLDADTEPNDTPTAELLSAVAVVTDLPIVAAGGIGTGADIDDLLARGAVAVQLGTALLDSDEAGTRPTHRHALRAAEFTETVVTRAFSGRPARGLRNRFIDDFDAFAPAEYPAVHHLTSGLRAAAAAADQPHDLNLWAGIAYREARRGPAADIIAALWAETAVAAAGHTR